MKKYLILSILCSVLSGTAFSQLNRNEVTLVISPVKLDEQSSYSLLYRKALKDKKNWSLRSGMRLLIDTDKETREDSSLSSNEGTVQLDLSAGLQRKLVIESLDKIYLYAGMDGYFNSEFNRKSYETYYGYYWDFGLRPLVGVSYEPFANIRFSLESQSNMNINLQEYSAPGTNKDQRITFNPLNQLAIGFGYLF